MSEDAPKPLIVLIAEDDEDDYTLILEALREAGMEDKTHWVKDGEELTDYLHQNAREDNKDQRTIGTILLDLNMPRKNGLEALAEIKAHPDFRKIPVIILTTSGDESDITKAYDLGANSYIQKPLRFSEYSEIIDVFRNYWFKAVKIPS